MFLYNVQHDCRQAKCTASGKRAVIQERVQTELGETESVIEHKPLDRFLINTHAFHNAHLIQAILPRDLTIPVAYSADRVAHHFSIFTNLHDIQGSDTLQDSLGSINTISDIFTTYSNYMRHTYNNTANLPKHRVIRRSRAQGYVRADTLSSVASSLAFGSTSERQQGPQWGHIHKAGNARRPVVQN